MVLLQEVVPESLKILEKECPQFKIYTQKEVDFFTAIMMHTTAVVYESHETIPFYQSEPNNSMLILNVKILFLFMLDPCFVIVCL